LNDGRILKYRRAVDEMRRGRFDPSIPIEGQDDVARLGKSLQKLAASLTAKFHEVSELAHVTEMINNGVVLEEVLDHMYEAFRSLIPYDRIGLALLEDRDRIVRARWSRSDSLNIELPQGYAARMSGSSLEGIIRSGRPRILNNLEEYLVEHPDSKSTRLILAEGIRSSLTCPLIALGKPVGFLFFSSRDTDTYKELHQGYFVQLASQISVILDKSRLYQELIDLNQQLRETQRTLQHEASHDALTGLWNRRAVLELLKRELARAQREERPFTTVMFDIDRFKEVNDKYGHLVGDEVLRELSQRVVSRLRAAEFCGRLGGEEFVIVLSLTNEASVNKVMERVRRACSDRPVSTDSGAIAVTISLGAALVVNPSSVELSDCLGAADRALYRAKERGRNRSEIETVG
jgi:diguanylate cyclase (GGDEF)-like protein